MSARGTNGTYRPFRLMTAFGGKADIPQPIRQARFSPRTDVRHVFVPL
jgi:hypothetical protein